MSKVYTANEMRETAKLYDARAKTTMEVCSRRGGSAMVTVFASEGISDRKVASMLRQAADSLEREAAKDAEIVRLRELVSELLTNLVINHCIGCQVDDCERCVYYAQNEAVAAKAREMIGGAE